ncbi:MAG: hypothetical protein VB131_09510 [Burkholderia gladioli]
MYAPAIRVQSLSGHVEARNDRELDAIFDAQDAFEEAVHRAADEVSADDVFNAMFDLPKSRRTAVLNAFLDRSDREHFEYLLTGLFEGAFNAAAEGIAKRKGY